MSSLVTCRTERKACTSARSEDFKCKGALYLAEAELGLTICKPLGCCVQIASNHHENTLPHDFALPSLAKLCDQRVKTRTHGMLAKPWRALWPPNLSVAAPWVVTLVEGKAAGPRDRCLLKQAIRMDHTQDRSRQHLEQESNGSNRLHYHSLWVEANPATLISQANRSEKFVSQSSLTHNLTFQFGRFIARRK